MKAQNANSPTHQVILTNSISRYSDAFPRASNSVMTTKPEIPLRVPIDRDQMLQKQKAKNIYKEERLIHAKENAKVSTFPLTSLHTEA